MAFMFAFTGFIAGLLSALLIYQRLLISFSERTCKAIMAGVMFLSGYGIYMGRFLRWNSWDILFHPLSILSDTYVRIANPFEHPLAYLVSITTGLLLTLTFFTMESFFNQATSNPAL
jgi:uncharacterized membrane protein